MSTPGPAAAPGSVAVLVALLGTRVREEIDAALAPLDLTMRHLTALGHLARRPGLSYSELARRGGITVQSTQATLRQLEGLDAVERRGETGRGRVAELHLTPTGRQLLTRADKAVAEVERVMLASLPRPERALLARTLGGMVARPGAEGS